MTVFESRSNNSSTKLLSVSEINIHKSTSVMWGNYAQWEMHEYTKLSIQSCSYVHKPGVKTRIDGSPFPSWFILVTNTVIEVGLGC